MNQLVLTDLKVLSWRELKEHKDLLDFLVDYKNSNNLVWAKNRYNGKITLIQKDLLNDNIVSDALSEIKGCDINPKTIIDIEPIINEYIEDKFRKLIKEVSEETGLKIILNG